MVGQFQSIAKILKRKKSAKEIKRLPASLQKEIRWLRGEKDEEAGSDEDDDDSEEDDASEVVLSEVFIKGWVKRKELPEPFYELTSVLEGMNLAEKLGVEQSVIQGLVEPMTAGMLKQLR